MDIIIIPAVKNSTVTNHTVDMNILKVAVIMKVMANMVFIIFTNLFMVLKIEAVDGT